MYSCFSRTPFVSIIPSLNDPPSCPISTSQRIAIDIHSKYSVSYVVPVGETLSALSGNRTHDPSKPGSHTAPPKSHPFPLGAESCMYSPSVIFPHLFHLTGALRTSTSQGTFPFPPLSPHPHPSILFYCSPSSVLPSLTLHSLPTISPLRPFPSSK